MTLLQQMLLQVVNDAAQSSDTDTDSDVSSTTSASTATSGCSSTITGIGMYSGRFIKGVGSLTLQSIEAASTQGRLLWMAIQLRRDIKNIPDSFYEDIMEWQKYASKFSTPSRRFLTQNRIFLYPRRVRKQAWDLIFLLLVNRRSDVIARVLSKWKSDEIKYFLSLLEICRLTGWYVTITI